MKLFSPLYDRVLRWAGHPHAEGYLVALSFAESSFFPIPPDVMLAPMTLARPARGWRLAFATTLASVAGGIAGYAIGWMGSMFYAMGIILQIVLGLTPADLGWTVAALGLLAVLYTTAGGVRAVIWTDVLQAATLGGARYMGLDDELGTVEAGKLADLVVLDADPLEDIENSTSIVFVIKNGEKYE